MVPMERPVLPVPLVLQVLLAHKALLELTD
jgi:hypothetical protein